MKSKDIQLRGGHKLEYISGTLWDFIPAWETCPVYLTYNENKTDIVALDADSMGMPLMVGCTVGEYKVWGIHEVDGKFKVCMLPLYKNKVKDLAPGDTVHVVDNAEFTCKKFNISAVECTINEDYTLLWNEANKHECIILQTKLGEGMKASDGIPVEHFPNLVVFLDEIAAKKYLYDKLQDKIDYLREAQRRLMMEATR